MAPTRLLEMLSLVLSDYRIAASDTDETFSIMRLSRRLLRCGAELICFVKTVPQENDPTVQEGTSVGGVLLWLIALGVLYVLSTGPVVRLMYQGRISKRAVETFYTPIMWFSKTSIGSVALRPCLLWYGDKLWGWGSVRP